MDNVTEGEEAVAPSYKKKDFMSDQMIRWCPGCGDYSILSQTQTVMAGLGIPKEDFAVVSGIGCSSRFPYYLETYGFHTIHGRAPAFSSGAKCANPDLSLWMITGDGDALAIGGNHTIHLVRRNVDIQVLLFNNRIYGLTKGQYSPTTSEGKVTKSSPMGSLDHPFEPLELVLGAQGTFLARAVDTYPKELRQVLIEAEGHTGTSYVEILQNCPIFNDKVFDSVVNRKVRDEKIIFLEHGQPMTFGAKDAPKGLRLNGLEVEIIELGGEYSEADCLVHDKTSKALANILVQLDYPDYPVPMGVLYQVERPTYNDILHAQIDASVEKKGKGKLMDLIYGGQTWTVE